MADPRVLRRLKTIVFWQEIRLSISIKKEGYGGMANTYFYPKMKGSDRDNLS